MPETAATTTPATPPAGWHVHVPKICETCGGHIFWAQLPTRRSIPVDSEPKPDGRVILVDRHGSVLARILGRGEAPPAGAILRRVHRCPPKCRRPARLP